MLLVPAPFGGVVILGASLVAYVNGAVEHAVGVEYTTYTCYGAIDSDGSRFLLGMIHLELFFTDLFISLFLVGD